MAELNENLIKFGWLTKDEMLSAIEDGNLNEYDICFTKDTHEEYIINSALEPISIKSRLRIYSSVDSAIADIKATTQTYEGEIISIKDGEKFIAYVVNKFEGGDYYISPVCSDGQVDYNDLKNIPIKKLDGSVTEPIVLNSLANGYYEITGHFVTPDGNEVTSIVGNLVLIESVGLTEKVIKRISTDKIIDYTVNTADGTYTSNKYATEQYVLDLGYVTEDDVDVKILAMQASLEEYVREYVATTATLLIKELINQELNNRYAEASDINELFQ